MGTVNLLRILKVLIVVWLAAICVQCYTPPKPDAATLEKLKSEDWIQFATGESDGDQFFLGNNTFAIGCDDYPGLLASDLESAVKTGQRCLKELGGEHAERFPEIAVLFNGEKNSRPVRIYCGRPGDKLKGHTIRSTYQARSTAIGELAHPGIFLNLNKVHDGSWRQRKGVLFHEMLHWLGP